jgi:signal transduction histidine kinase
MAEEQPISGRILAARVDLLREKHDLVLLGVVGTSVLLTALLWSRAPTLALAAWLVAQLMLTAARYVLARWYDRVPPPRRDYRLWARRFMIGSALSGLAWGALPVFCLVPGEVMNMLLITIGLVGMSAAALGALSIHVPSLVAYVVPNLVMLAATVAVGGYPEVAALVIPYLLALIGFGHVYNSSLTRSLELRFENEDLIEALREQHRIAEQANRGKSDLLAAASHDLRQPVHAMGFFVDALESYRLAPEAAELVGRIKRSLFTLDGLFHSLLEMSRLEAGMIRPQPRAMRLDPVIAALVEEYQPIARRRGLRLMRVPTHVSVESDPVLLERMLRNIVSNAVRYTKSGGVVVGVRRRGARVAIEVSDTGPGMTESECTAAFQAFRRLEHTADAIDFGEGLGLGLAIVGHVSRLLHHPLELRSVPGRGSTFRLLLPRAAAPEPLVETRVQSEEVLRGRRVLVLDDDPDVCDALQAALERWGCHVRVAGTPGEALASVEPAPDIVIADYRLPGNETGTQALRAIERRLGHAIPALLITGDTAPERLENARSAGYPLLRKPVTPAQLRTALHRLMQGQLPGQAVG